MNSSTYEIFDGRTCAFTGVALVEKFMHGIKVLMAKNYVDNLSEETRKGMLEKAVLTVILADTAAIAASERWGKL